MPPKIGLGVVGVLSHPTTRLLAMNQRRHPAPETHTSHDGAMTTLLERPIYGMYQVDALLGLVGGTARRWIDGYERGGKSYAPVVRLEPTGEEAVTWGEFVETRLLAEYRDRGVPLIRMRPVVERLRNELGLTYPLAHALPFVSNRELVAAVQDDVDLDDRLRIVEVLRTGQIELAFESRSFWEAVEWEPASEAGLSEIAARLHVFGKQSPVMIDPLRSFGAPTVGSVRTDVVAEEVRAGAALAFVAAGFGITLREAAAAVEYEERVAA
jgi:hypothetical protein